MLDAVFLFDRDDDLNVFDSTERAERSMEAIDVANGEYVAIYREDGARLTPSIVNGRVTLSATGEIDHQALSARLGDYANRWPSVPQTDDPASFASAWLAPRRQPRHEGPPSLRHAPAWVVVPPLIGAVFLLRGIAVTVGARGASQRVLGIVLVAVGIAVLTLLALHWSGYWWRRRHPEH